MSEVVAASLKGIYLTLRIINDDELDFENVSRKLDLEPSSVMLRGQFLHQQRTRADWSSWHYSTKGLDSLSIKAHMAVLFKKLEGKRDVLEELRRQGCRTSVSCYWLCSGGDNIEAYLSHKNIQQLAEFGLDFWFDIYAGCPSD